MKDSNNDILIYNIDGKPKVNVIMQNENIWLNQAQMVDLFGVSKTSISEHISFVLNSGELDESSTVRKIRTVQKEGDREV